MHGYRGNSEERLASVVPKHVACNWGGVDAIVVSDFLIDVLDF